MNYNQPDNNLIFAEDDCYNAVSANPRNKRAIEYLTTAAECRYILEHRAMVRIYRQDSRSIYDPLEAGASPQHREIIRNRNRTPYIKRRINSAVINLGFYNLEKRGQK